MLYIVELDFPHPELLEEWQAWYTQHLQVLLSVPGFRSAQRFQSVTPSASPFVAIYSIDAPDVMTSPEYRERGGRNAPGRWSPLMTNWHRNVLEGIDRAPEVADGGWLAVLDRLEASSPPLPEGYVRLTPLALDRTVVERGLLFGDAATPPPALAQAPGAHMRICKPITPLLESAAR